MLSERSWRPEVLLLFLALLLLSFGAGSMLITWLLSDYAPISLPKDYVLLVGGTLSFHGVILVLLPAFLRCQGLDIASAFGISKFRGAHAALSGLFAGLCALPVTIVLAELSGMFLQSHGVDIQLQAPVEALRNDPSVGLRAVVFVAAVLVAPVAEEFFFRGILYSIVKQAGFPRLALWGTSVLFAMAHVNLLTFVPLIALGLILASLYEVTDNLIAPMVMHGFFNLVNFVQIVLSPPP
jgi:membrane protease YdiL (CAAX protease family)